MSVTETAASLRELAEQSNAWPFEEARKIVARLKKTAQGRGDLRDRLRPLRPAAYRHVRRGGAHHHGAPRLPRADRRQDQDAADRVLRRHGRAAQGARQRAEQGDAGAASRQAADQGAGPVRHASVVRRAQQRAAARLPRHVRLRIRVHVVDAVLHVRPLRRDAAEGAGALRRGDERSCCRRCARSGRRPIRRSCRSIRAPASCCRCRCWRTTPRRGTITYEEPETQERFTDAGHRRALQAAMEAGLGDALGRARHRLRDGRQGPDRFGEALRRNLPRARRARRRKASTTSCSSTRRARRFPSRRATA